MKLVFTEADWLKGEQLDYSLFKEQQYQVYGARYCHWPVTRNGGFTRPRFITSSHPEK